MARVPLRHIRLTSACVCIATATSLTAQTKPAAAPAVKAAIPKPESVFGFPAGADNKLFTYDQSIEYFRKLAKAAPTRVKLLDVGKTSFGHAWTAVLISSPANLAKLERYREINQKLARPEGLKPVL